MPQALVVIFHRFRSIAVLLSALALVSTPAYATTLRHIALPDLVSRSETVVLGTALKRQSYWDEGRIVTRITFAIDEVWVDKAQSLARNTGDTPATVDVVTLGGAINGIGQRVDGAFSSNIGDHAVMCLKRNSRGHYNVVGMSLGAFFVDAGQASSAKPQALTVQRRLSGAHVSGEPTHGAGRDAAAEFHTLGELKTLIQEAARAQ